MHLKAGYPRALMAGAHLSRFQGRGVEFDEVRAYQPGDDIRSMDWRVTARTGKPHTKLFREERERPALVLLDMRPAMFFATRGALKAVVATECASLLAWSVMQQGDRIGSLIFADADSNGNSDGDGGNHTQLLRPVRGKRGVLRMLGNVINQPHWQQRSTSVNESKTLEHILHRASHAAHTGSLIIIVSDGRGLNDSCMNLLKRLLKHHSIVFVLIYDAFEADMPNVGQLQTSDGQQQRSIDTGNNHLRQQHHDCFSKRQALLQELAQRPGFVLLQCATDDDPFSVLQASLGR